ncbi:DNA/RNA helicase domain-containing protein [Nocardiopsis dassonvillei]|uniref:DNA/RNA helicase domain-containing protein n=1 Tax=Nocardiopsis dassonvillei TaxID=2014 RepID=UPI0036700AF5
MRETSPITPLRFVHAGRVGDTARELERPDFIERCRARYRAVGFGDPDKAEVRSWRNSWPPLLHALVRAGLEDLWIYLEFGTPEGDSRFDVLLLGRRGAEELVGVVVELKQWSVATSAGGGEVRLLNEETTRKDPLAQLASYTAFLKQWFSSESIRMDTRGLVFLHNATPDEAEAIPRISDVPLAYRNPVVSGDEVKEAPGPEALRALFSCGDVEPPTDGLVKAFEAAEWRANPKLLSAVGDVLERNRSFVLLGDQRQAFHEIRTKINDALVSGRRSIILVQGGPGSGKTVLAMRLLAAYMKDPRARARYGTPSGALTRNLRDAVGVPGSEPLFRLPSKAVRDSRLVIIDEAHRLSRHGGGFGGYVTRFLEDVPVIVVFLDERQRVRPTEGVWEQEVRRFADGTSIEVVTHSLNGSFRCNGSRQFNVWVDDLLYGDARTWRGNDYDLGLSANPWQMERWLEDCLEEDDRVARISAGFCWGWEKTGKGEALPAVSIEWRDHQHEATRRWERPWNLHRKLFDKDTGEYIGPDSQVWATEPGGERQVGCVYTAQGLEYDDAGVILGPDLVRRGDHWEAHPEESRDPAMTGVGAQEYLELALNTYRVLMTRGMRSCRLYSTDEETQDFLASLMPRNPA